ncbi:unnamed protein product [Caenorhabditis auriculariae]|uniref:DRBM domain-containing protein n=1 Tax=Caenorhabditis auriculariae TaxID=2777116 RepID=A0A8S1H7E2_9PELO|nr:unnamed protein product [Caenorhabditis auriculariae]
MTETDGGESEGKNETKFANDVTNVTSLGQNLNTMAVAGAEQPKVHPQPWCGNHLASQDERTNVYNYSDQDAKGKSAMYRVAEIARFNKLRHVYSLLDESGPAHKKLFTVRLNLNADQNFIGSGCSIKKAQQAAAMQALEKTTLSIPPERVSRKKKENENKSPIQLLHHVCRTLGMREPVITTTLLPNASYMFENGAQDPKTLFPALPPSSSCDCFARPFNEQPSPFLYGVSMFDRPIGLNFNNLQSPLATPCTNGNLPPTFNTPLHMAAVTIGPDTIETALGITGAQAKTNAAIKALAVLEPSIRDCENRTKNMLRNAKNEEHPIPKHKEKSVISDVHEKAAQLKTDVVFEVLVEEGPPHDRKFVIRCSLRSGPNEIYAEATGTGSQKKEAKQDACSRLLKELQLVENTPIHLASSLFKSQKKLQSMPKEKRKTLDKDKKMDPDYGHQINPVSRLIQILQTKGGNYANFEFIGEQGQSRYKEFIMRVTCGDLVHEGRGPNKRLAKRAAAEAMLASIGYEKPLPAPGKSLLKRKTNEYEQLENSGKTSENVVPLHPSPVEGNPPPINENVKKNEAEENEGTDDSSRPISPFEEISIEEATSGSPEASRRRVTFSNQVEACPPPGDVNYPNSEITTLNLEVVVEGKVRKIRRIKEGRRALTAVQRGEVSLIAKNLIKTFNLEKNSPNPKTPTASAREQLDTIGQLYKFTVQYTILPEHSEHFTLVTLGLEEPVVCHGKGETTELATEYAALTALCRLSELATAQSSSQSSSTSRDPSA